MLNDSGEKASPIRSDPHSALCTGLSNSNHLKCYCIQSEAASKKDDMSEIEY